MRKSLCILFLSLLCCVCDAQMYSWHSLLAYGNAISVEVAPKMVYVQAGTALYAVDLTTEETITYSKQDGLHGASIAQIAYSNHDHCLVIMYENGLIDFLYDNGEIISMMDISQKEMVASKKANAILMVDSLAYVSMPFGLMVLNTTKRQVVDTYYIGENGSEVNILGCTLTKDSIFAYGEHTIYSISRQDNPMDFSYWKREKATDDITYSGIGTYDDSVYVLKNNLLSKRVSGLWQTIRNESCWTIQQGAEGLYIPLLKQGYLTLTEQGFVYTQSSSRVYDVVKRGQDIWLAMGVNGVMRIQHNETQLFSVDGPIENYPYRLRVSDGNLIMTPGGYYVVSSDHPGTISVMQQNQWVNFTNSMLTSLTRQYLSNICDGIIDPKDPTHFFAASFGNGLLEFRNNQFYKRYNARNSFLDSIISPATSYTWVDALAFDSQNNLWMMNVSKKNNIKVLRPNGQAVAIQNADADLILRARDLLIWNQNEHIKIISSSHQKVGLVVLDDGGTIEKFNDDKSVFCTQFVDQDNRTLQLEGIYCIAQTKEGAIWIGLNAGIVIIDDPSKLFHSSACRKIKIPRNDGTNLADYLLETEQINAIVVDGANRKWIGTASSGLYLISEDGLETIEHFTEDNSPLLSNEILSLALEPITGQVFIGTSAGLMVYQSDASMPSDSYSNAYAYPNPVRPDYEGVIAITGLMDESAVHIIDNAGNLVCETRSYGGQAVWDGKTGDGRRVASGVYSALCNEPGGGHAVVKILVMH